MGNKVALFKIWGKGKEYHSDWYSSYADYPENIMEDHRIRSLLQSLGKKHRWDMSEVNITRISNHVHVEIKSAKPGVVIGKSGKDLELLKLRMLSILRPKTNLTIQVNPVRRPEIDAHCVSEKIADDISKGKQYKFLIKKYVAEAMRLGAKGIKVICSGRLNGVEIARTFSISEGSVPRHTMRAKIDYALAVAETNSGLCGVKVWVYKGMRDR